MTQSCNGTLTYFTVFNVKNLHANEKPKFVPRTSPLAPGLTLRPQPRIEGRGHWNEVGETPGILEEKKVFCFLITPKVLRRLWKS